MVGRREEGLGLKEIELIAPQIGVLVDGFEIKEVALWAQYGGRHVTEVPAGSTFEIHIAYDIRNTLAGITYWSISMTVYNVTDAVAVNNKNRGNVLGSYWRRYDDAVNVKMPSHNTSFQVKIFCNQAAFAGTPPEEMW